MIRHRGRLCLRHAKRLAANVTQAAKRMSRECISPSLCVSTSCARSPLAAPLLLLLHLTSSSLEKIYLAVSCSAALQRMGTMPNLVGLERGKEGIGRKRWGTASTFLLLILRDTAPTHQGPLSPGRDARPTRHTMRSRALRRAQGLQPTLSCSASWHPSASLRPGSTDPSPPVPVSVVGQ